MFPSHRRLAFRLTALGTLLLSLPVLLGMRPPVLGSNGRSIQIVRNGKSGDAGSGLVTRVVDARGGAIQYAYNAKGELSEVTDRAGGKRQFKYEDALRPHFLTRVIVVRPGGDVEIAYDYNSDNRLGEIDTGAGAIGMEYADGEAGAGTQTVVDKGTGSSTKVTYDGAGRVTRKEEPGQVVTEYAYYDANDNPDDPHPGAVKGAVASQTVGGVRTEFSYGDFNDPPFAPEYKGYEGIARQMIDYQLWKSSPEGVIGNTEEDEAESARIRNDYAMGDTMKPGYLTDKQVQPEHVATPAIGPDGGKTEKVWR